MFLSRILSYVFKPVIEFNFGMAENYLKCDQKFDELQNKF